MNTTNMLRSSIALLVVTLLVACDGRNPLVPPAPSTFLVLSSANTIGVSAPPGSADTGTTVSIAAGGTGSGTAAPDGSVAFNATATGGTITLNYIKSNQTLTTDATVQPLASRVTNPLFSTGSAPNDMEIFAEGLLVANSLDNSANFYRRDGSEIGSANYPQFASPSYIAWGQGGFALVINNGDNNVAAYTLPAIGEIYWQETVANPAAAFAGLGKAATENLFSYVPQANIHSFSPTSYGPGLISVLSIEGDEPQRDTQTSGHNAVFAYYSGNRAEDAFGIHHLYVVSAGELHFDENFNPSITTDSYLDDFAVTPDGTLTLNRSLNLGPIGASAFLPLSDGEFGYLGNLISGDVYKVALADFSVVRGQSNPIVLTEEFTYVGDLEFVPETDLLLATSFNTDELYVIDTATDTVSPAPYPGPFDLSLDPQLLAGASAVEVDAGVNPPVAYVLLGLANAVARVELLP